jgi:hypothetical protein
MKKNCAGKKRGRFYFFQAIVNYQILAHDIALAGVKKKGKAGVNL